MTFSIQNKQSKRLVVTALLLGIFSIILGAFAAHGLENHVDESAISTFEVGVRYQMYTAFFLLIVGLMPQISASVKNRILIISSFGILFFSGSIYGLSTNTLTSFNFKAIALITPIGGLLLIAAWIQLLISVLKLKTE